MELLDHEDAIMELEIFNNVTQFLDLTLRSRNFDPADPDLPPEEIYDAELEALKLLVQSYTGLGGLCSLVAKWSGQTETLISALARPSDDEADRRSGDFPNIGRRDRSSRDSISKDSLQRESVSRADSSSKLLSRQGSPACESCDGDLPASQPPGAAGEQLIIECLCAILSQEFHPEPYKLMLASQEGHWSPPHFYWTLLLESPPIVVDTFGRLYDRYRGSEFLGAFLQDYCCDRSEVDKGARRRLMLQDADSDELDEVDSEIREERRRRDSWGIEPRNRRLDSHLRDGKDLYVRDARDLRGASNTSGGLRGGVQLSEITAQFSIFTKAFGELLVEFLLEDDNYELGDLDPNNICKLLCHAENAYCYAQALLHFLPYCQAELLTCRRLSQLIYRNLRFNKMEYAAADRLLLCTSLPNYPELFELSKPLRDVDDYGRIHLTSANICQLCDGLARVIRRFEKHQTILLFHDARGPAGRGDTETFEDSEFSNDLSVDETRFNSYDDKVSSDSLQNDPVNPRRVGIRTARNADWETEMLEATTLPTSDGLPLDFFYTPPNPRVRALSVLKEAANEAAIDSLTPGAVLQPVEWPAAAEVKTKQKLPVEWELPSASQAGDDTAIMEAEAEERDRRGSAKLISPPMDSLRETLLLESLWDYLVCGHFPNCPIDLPVNKLVELLLMLSTLTAYELVVMHLRAQAAEDQEAAEAEREDEDFEDDDDGDFEPFQDDLEVDEGMTPVKPERHFFLRQNSIHFATPPSTLISPAESSVTVSDSLVSLDGAEDEMARARRAQNNSVTSSDDEPVRKKRRLGPTATSVVSSYWAKSRVPSIIESSVYKDPHEGARLRAFKSEDPLQAATLSAMFRSSTKYIDLYKRKARRELFDLHRISCQARDSGDGLSDLVMYKLCVRSLTSAGASAGLRFLEEELLPASIYRWSSSPREEKSGDPLQKVTPAVLTYLMRVSMWHPRKRVLVIALCKKLLQESFVGPFQATEETQILRRRLISLAVAQMSLTEPAFDWMAENSQVPWRAMTADWNAVVAPGYKLVFNLIQELLPCFDLMLLRETLEFVLVICSPPYTSAFAEKLADLLKSIALLGMFNFFHPVNAALQKHVTAALDALSIAWAPDDPPKKVMEQLQIVGEAVGARSGNIEEGDDENGQDEDGDESSSSSGKTSVDSSVDALDELLVLNDDDTSSSTACWQS